MSNELKLQWVCGCGHIQPFAKPEQPQEHYASEQNDDAFDMIKSGDDEMWFEEVE